MKLALKAMGIAAVLALGACAVAPTEPDVLALPGTGKTLEQFQADDGECRQYGSGRSGQGSGDSYDAQRRYDVAYIQCMYSKGHKVPVLGAYTGAPAGQIAPPPPPAPAATSAPAPSAPPPPAAASPSPEPSPKPE